MWFLNVDGRMWPVQSCTHPVRFVEITDPWTAHQPWCGLCGTVGALK